MKILIIPIQISSSDFNILISFINIMSPFEGIIEFLIIPSITLMNGYSVRFRTSNSPPIYEVKLERFKNYGFLHDSIRIHKCR